MLRKQELLKAHLQTWVIRSLTSEGLGEQQWGAHRKLLFDFHAIPCL